MLAHVGIAGIGVLSAAAVAVVFFCGIELAPKVAYRVARMTRYSGLERSEKLVRFW